MANKRTIRWKHAPLAFAALLAAGCSGVGPYEKQQIKEVNAQIAEAEQMAVVRQHARSFLTVAKETLNEAWSASSTAEARHLIYLARRRVEIARYVAGVKDAEQTVQSLPMKRTDRRRARSDKARVQAAVEHAGLVPPRRPKLPGQTASANIDLLGSGMTKDRIWTVFPVQGVVTEGLQSGLSVTVSRDLDPLIQYLRDNEKSTVLIKASLAASPRAQHQLAASIDAAETIKAYLIGKKIESARIFTLARINRPPSPQSRDAPGAAPIARLEIALFEGRDLSMVP